VRSVAIFMASKYRAIGPAIRSIRMAKTWATSGTDLHLDLAAGRVRASLEKGLRDAVQSGRLGPGTRLPSSRALAVDLGIARNTVAEAYGQLVAEGWLTATVGSGTRVADFVAQLPSPASSVTAVSRRTRYDLRAGTPTLTAFPRSAWIAATRKALLAAPYEALGYTNPQGRRELRSALAGYLARARGVHVDPERVVICAGFSHGLSLLCRVLRLRGGSALVTEAYGLPNNVRIVANSGLALTTLRVDDRGAVLDDLGTHAAVLLTPAHQFPLGPVLAAERRTTLVEWAARTGGLVIEDDYDGEFRYDRQPLGALQALAPERVVYAGTASKTLAPGLRLGWLVLPHHLVGDVVAAQMDEARHTSTIEQLALAEMITSGAYDRHVRRSRLSYRRRRDRLVTALQDRAPRVRVTGIAAGMHALVELPDGECEGSVIERAAEHGLDVEGLCGYALGAHTRGPALVVGYATPPDHLFTSAVSRLATVLSLGMSP
jgi:GntR family transcriptional regulator/MocR family aminotransferase